MAAQPLSSLAFQMLTALSNKIVLSDAAGSISSLNVLGKWLHNGAMPSSASASSGPTTFAPTNLARTWNVDSGLGNDIIDASASSANNRLLGGWGDDTITGGSGQDRIDGGRGNDNLFGGAGRDTFVLSAGRDIIRDFHPATKTTVLIDFEGLHTPTSGPTITIPNGYKGLEWGEFAGGDTQAVSSSHPGFGSTGAIVVNAPNSSSVGMGSHVGLVTFSDVNNDFDFVGGFFAAVLPPVGTSVQVTIKAFDDGQVVGTASFDVDALHKTTINLLDFSGLGNRFTSIDRVDIETAGTEFQKGIVMDDLLLAYGSGPGDVLDAGGADVSAILNSARSDGNGGTILTHAQGTITLVGVDPAGVSAEWFGVA